MARMLAVDAREFVVAWQMGGSVDEVKQLLGMEQAENRLVSAKASVLRRSGVPLKRMRQGERYDYETLTDLATWVVNMSNAGADRNQITVRRFLQERQDQNGNG